MRQHDPNLQLVPAVPKAEQQRILDTWVRDIFDATLDDEDLKEDLIRRLEAGAAKYGTSWNEVDLATDIYEELGDTINYLAMMEVRLMTAAPFPVTDIVLFLRSAIGRVESLMMALDFLLPAFEGPTSKDWVTQQGLDPKVQQAKFQEIVNRS